VKLTWTAQDEEFRANLRAFLAEHAPGKPPRDAPARLAWQRAWAAVKFDHGWSGPSWPRELGGMELSFPQQVIYHQEMAAARAPAHPGTGINMVGPTLIRHGSAAQQARYLRPMLRADELWAQAFSEPEAGSDLASLRTAAVRDRDWYVVSGQKVWNSNADIADLFFALVRTGTRQSREKGISYLLIDAHSPGVIVRPLRDMTGQSRFTEIHFDSVRIPIENRVGEENEGWAIARTTLGHERAAEALNQAAFYDRVLGELIALARERGSADDPVLRDRLADYVIRSRIMQVSAIRTISRLMASDEPGPTASVSRLYNSTFEQELHVLATDLLGAYGVLATDDARAIQRGRWTQGMLRTRASTIGAGTAEIQRNIIAEQVLGLPRDPALPG
jgi:alkylation response protein AidB-like acyl-CoA dehydrogenase